MTITKSTLRLVAAMLVTVAVIGLSTVAHTPAQNHTWLTLKNIRTDSATVLYVNNRADRGSWFCEMTLPISAYADNRANRGAWFCEQALPTGDNAATQNLKSVAATL